MRCLFEQESSSIYHDYHAFLPPHQLASCSDFSDTSTTLNLDDNAYYMKNEFSIKYVQSTEKSNKYHNDFHQDSSACYSLRLSSFELVRVKNFLLTGLQPWGDISELANLHESKGKLDFLLRGFNSQAFQFLRKSVSLRRDTHYVMRSAYFVQRSISFYASLIFLQSFVIQFFFYSKRWANKNHVSWWNCSRQVVFTQYFNARFNSIRRVVQPFLDKVYWKTWYPKLLHLLK